MTLLLALAIFAVLVLLGYALSALALDRQQAQQALSNRLTTMAGASSGTPIAQSLLKDQRLSNIPILDAVLGSTPFIAPLVRMIEQAGLRRRVGEVLLYVVMLFFIVMLSLLVTMHDRYWPVHQVRLSQQQGPVEQRHPRRSGGAPGRAAGTAPGTAP